MKFESKGKQNIFLSVKSSAIAQLADFSKLAKSKFQNLDKEEKNNNYNKLNYLENLISMLTYEQRDFFFDTQLTSSIMERVEKEISDICKVASDIKNADVILANINLLITAHSASSRLIYQSKDFIKPVYLDTKSIYFNYVLSAKQGSFENNFVKIKPKKVKYKIWKKGEAKPEVLNEDALIGKDKFITEIYSFGSDYVYLEATETEIVLALKNMDDKSKDIKKVLSIEELKNFINNSSVNQMPAIYPAPVEAIASKPAEQPETKPVVPSKPEISPTLPVAPEAPETAPEADSAGVDEAEEVIDDEEQDMLSSYIDETEDEDNQTNN